MKLSTFLFINFIVAFVSDIVLNDVSRMYSKNHMLGSLQPYFQDKMITVAGIYAGITIALAVLFVSLVTRQMIGFYVPYTLSQLVIYVCIAYVCGYIIDVLIEYLDIFGKSLRQFYKVTGSGHSGALAFTFSIILSYILQKYLLPIL